VSGDFPALAGFGAGSFVAGYRLIEQVGAGGMAVVFKARDQRLDRVVALKILAPALAADERFRRRFIAESRAAAAVDDPHIIPVHEAGEAGGVLFIAMRFVAGGDLRRVLELEGPLPPGRAAGLISPVASALDAAHRAGLVHRDVKPANILIDAHQDRPDHVYLSDFGVSKGAMSSVSMTGTGQFLGTPEYSSPEQVKGQAVDGRADQYALACVAWQLLTGSAPFERDQGLAVLLAHLSDPPPSLAGRRPDLPEAAGLVLARALAKVPENRYASCREFADALRDSLGVPPWISFVTAAPPSHPRTEISAGPVFPRPDAVEATAAAGIAQGHAPPAADPAAAGESTPTVTAAVPRPAATIRKPGMPDAEPGMQTADRPRPAAAMTPGQPARPGAGPALQAPPPRYRRRPPLVIGLACAFIAAAVAVPLVVAHLSHATLSRLPGRAGASSGPGTPGSHGTPATAKPPAVNAPGHKETLLAQGAVARGPAGDATAQSSAAGKEPADLAGFSWSLLGTSLRFTISYYNTFNPDLDATIYLRTTPGPAGANCPGLAGAQYGIVVYDGYGSITHVSTTCSQQSTTGTATVSKTGHGWIISVPATAVGLGNGGLTQVRVLSYTDLSPDSTTPIQDYLPDINDSPLLIDVPKSS
jgi:tRNA A-37 threonylcarbamoyl transferase component Bud32